MDRPPIAQATDPFTEANADEILVAEADQEDGTTKEVQLRARLDPQNGGLEWVPMESEGQRDPKTISMLRSRLAAPLRIAAASCSAPCRGVASGVRDRGGAHSGTSAVSVRRRILFGVREGERREGPRPRAIGGTGAVRHEPQEAPGCPLSDSAERAH